MVNRYMARGVHTTIEFLSHRLLQRWVPKWYEAFSDQETGGFFERLGHSFKPVFTGRRRLITQCRQLAIYSHAKMQGAGRELPGLEERFDFIVDKYYVPETGGWIFSIDDEGHSLDRSYDLYAHSFVIFALAQYYQASGDEKVRALARGTLGFIDSHFRLPAMPGLCEALDRQLKPLERVRRHESHMHLLESSLFAAETFHEMPYTKLADELVDLFVNYFYDAERNLLSEYYTQELLPQTQGGHIVTEPGHYCEWIWLLKRHARESGREDLHDGICMPMLEWASTRGWDAKYGGIYDELDPDGHVIADTKRIWPLSEALKANALMLDSGVDKKAVKDRIRKMVKVFRRHYMEERGFWTEWLKRDLTRETDYMPGTTPYHVYFGIMETRGVLHERGRTRSLVAGPQMTLYRWRRQLSDRIREFRLHLKALHSGV